MVPQPAVEGYEARAEAQIRDGMARLPSRYAPLVYGVLQAAVTTAVATAVATHQWTAFGLQFLEQWFLAWLLAWATMMPVVIFLSPLIQRCVEALTTSGVARDRE